MITIIEFIIIEVGVPISILLIGIPILDMIDRDYFEQNYSKYSNILILISGLCLLCLLYFVISNIRWVG